MRLPVLPADTDPDNRSKHRDSDADRVKTPSILQFHPGPRKGTMILEVKLEYRLSTGEHEWHKELYNVLRIESDYCIAVRQNGLPLQKNFALRTCDVDEQVTYDTVTFVGYIFCYHDLPVPTDEEEVKLLVRLKEYARTWITITIKQYEDILAKVEKIPETPWHSSHS